MPTRNTIRKTIQVATLTAPVIALAQRSSGVSRYRDGDWFLVLLWVLVAALVAAYYFGARWIKKTRLYARVERFVPSWGMLGSCLLLAFLAMLAWFIVGLPLLRWLR